MKRKFIFLLLVLFTGILITGCSLKTSKDDDIDISNIDNKSFVIDKDSIITIDNNNRLSVSTESIKKNMINTGRFYEGKIFNLEDGTYDARFYLDKYNDDQEGIASLFYNVKNNPKNSTEIVSYNFSKENFEKYKDNIYWGLEVILSIFDVDGTEDIYKTIEKNAKTTSTSQLGDDYECYQNEGKNIRVICANLKYAIQIDIRTID